MPTRLIDHSRQWDVPDAVVSEPEDPRYLSEQLVTYIGNKRALLPLIQDAMAHVQERLNKPKLRILDAFAGSGVASRYFKQFADYLVSNDLEHYAHVVGRCYLSNESEIDLPALRESHRYLLDRVDAADFLPGVIRRLYSPRDDKNILPGDRVFYTNRNATRLDNFRRLIAELPSWQHPFFLGPLLSEASVHANTSGVFKGFYKNSQTGVGQFGGNGQDALLRIMGEIGLPFPIFSRFNADCEVRQQDANQLVCELTNLDVAYFDPPYNQHPYGSNYFMLNLLVDYIEPQEISTVSGIPTDWNRSAYNKRGQVFSALRELFDHTDARFILLSYNDEGFVSREEIESLMARHGKVTTYEKPYNTFRGCRNLRNRPIKVTEHLFLVERS